MEKCWPVDNPQFSRKLHDLELYDKISKLDKKIKNIRLDLDNNVNDDYSFEIKINKIIKNENKAIAIYREIDSNLYRIAIKNLLFITRIFDAEYIQSEKLRAKTLGVFKKAFECIKEDIQLYSISLITAISASVIVNTFINRTDTEYSFSANGMVSGIVEEIIFRFMLQNCFHGGQKIIEKLNPSRLKHKSIIQMITAPSTRILATHLIFAVCHITNPGNTASQVARIILFNNYSLRYETHGLVATMAAHVFHNGTVELIMFAMGIV